MEMRMEKVGDEKIYTISLMSNLRSSHCHFHSKFMDQNNFYAKLNINGKRSVSGAVRV